MSVPSKGNYLLLILVSRYGLILYKKTKIFHSEEYFRFQNKVKRHHFPMAEQLLKFLKRNFQFRIFLFTIFDIDFCYVFPQSCFTYHTLNWEKLKI